MLGDLAVGWGMEGAPELSPPAGSPAPPADRVSRAALSTRSQRDGAVGDFAEVFRELLERETRRGLLKKQLAHACGMRPDYFSHLLSGRRRPTHPGIVARIAAGLQLSERDSARLSWAAGFPPSKEARNIRRAAPRPSASAGLASVTQGGRFPPRSRVARAALFQADRVEDDSVMATVTYNNRPAPRLVEWSLPMADDGGTWRERHHLFSELHLSGALLDCLAARQGWPRSWDRGAVIRRAGDPVDSLHVIVRGCVAAAVTVGAGFSVTYQVLGPGDMFGEASLLSSNASYPGSIRALVDTKTLAVGRHTLQHLRHDQGAAEGLIELLAGRVDQLALRLIHALHAPAEERVLLRIEELAAVFVRVAGTEGTSQTLGKTEVTIPIRQAELAELAGTARSVVATVLRRLASQGILRGHRGHIVVVDVEAIRKSVGS